jgi:hypothetical protein
MAPACQGTTRIALEGIEELDRAAMSREAT